MCCGVPRARLIILFINYIHKIALIRTNFESPQEFVSKRVHCIVFSFIIYSLPLAISYKFITLPLDL